VNLRFCNTLHVRYTLHLILMSEQAKNKRWIKKNMSDSLGVFCGWTSVYFWNLKWDRYMFDIWRKRENSNAGVKKIAGCNQEWWYYRILIKRTSRKAGGPKNIFARNRAGRKGGILWMTWKTFSEFKKSLRKERGSPLVDSKN